jgi:4,5-dihydroxyphthalate decarboxylase
MFRHSCIYVNTDKGIARPADLRGKRAGMEHYDSSAMVWIRGILQEHYGVSVADVEYEVGGNIEPLCAALVSGTLDALCVINPLTASVKEARNVRRLFVDYPLVEKEHFAKTGVFPIMHTVVIRRPLYESQSLDRATSKHWRHFSIYHHDRGLSKRRVPVIELFAPELLDT